MSLLVPSETRLGLPTPRPPPPALSELDAQVAAFRHEVHFSSATPVSQWIRLADRLKRQADQHHNAGDLEHQYLWYVQRSLFSLAKCAKILDELLPHEHSGWAKIDDEHRAHVSEVRLSTHTDRRNDPQHGAADARCHLRSAPRARRAVDAEYLALAQGTLARPLVTAAHHA